MCKSLCMPIYISAAAIETRYFVAIVIVLLSLSSRYQVCAREPSPTLPLPLPPPRSYRATDPGLGIISFFRASSDLSMQILSHTPRIFAEYVIRETGGGGNDGATDTRSGPGPFFSSFFFSFRSPPPRRRQMKNRPRPNSPPPATYIDTSRPRASGLMLCE